MKETLMLEELMGCAGIPARGSCRVDMVVPVPVPVPVLESMKFRLVLFWAGQVLLEPSRRLREGECWREMGAEERSWPWPWLPSPSAARSKGANRRNRVRMLVVRSSKSREIAWFRWTSSTTQVRSASTTRSWRSNDTRTSSSFAPSVNVLSMKIMPERIRKHDLTGVCFR